MQAQAQQEAWKASGTAGHNFLHALARWIVYLWDDPSLDKLRRLAFWAIFAITTLTIAIAAPWTTTRWGHDIAVFLDGGWRILHGQIPYIDFSSSGLGPTALGFAALSLKLAGGNASGLAYMSAMAFAGVALWAYWAGGTRLHTSERVCLALLLGCIASAPHALGFARNFTGYAMSYNRWGYGLLGITTLIAFARPLVHLEPVRDRWISASAGAAAVLLAFIKPTFGAAAVAVIATGFLVRTISLQRLIAMITSATVVSLAFLIYLRFDIGAIISDLSMIGKTRTAVITPTLVMNAGTALLPDIYIIGVVGLLVMLAAGRSVQTREWQWILAFGALFGLSILLTITNFQGKSAPLLMVLVLMMLSSGRIAQSTSWREDTAKLLRAGVIAAGLVGLILPALAFEAMSIVRSSILSPRDRRNPNFVRFDSPTLAALTMAEHGMNCPEAWCVDPFNGAAYVNRVNDGLKLLRAHAKPEETIGIFEQASMFNLGLGHRPPRGWPLFFAYNFTFNERYYLPASRVFHDADLVIAPKHSSSPKTTDLLWTIYGDELKRRYALVAESSEWTLYRRR